MSISSYTAVTMVDSRNSAVTLSVPKSTDILYRIVTFKDLYGSANYSTITLVTRTGDTFEDGTFSTILTNSYQSLNLYAGQPGKWINVNNTGAAGNITTVSNIAIYGSNTGATNTANILTVSNTTVTNTANILTVSNIAV